MTADSIIVINRDGKKEGINLRTIIRVCHFRTNEEYPRDMLRIYLFNKQTVEVPGTASDIPKYLP